MKAYFSVEQVDGNLHYLITSMLVLESSSCSEKVNQVQMYEWPTILVLLKRSSSGSRPFNDNKWKWICKARVEIKNTKIKIICWERATSFIVKLQTIFSYSCLNFHR